MIGFRVYSFFRDACHKDLRTFFGLMVGPGIEKSKMLHFWWINALVLLLGDPDGISVHIYLGRQF